MHWLDQIYWNLASELGRRLYLMLVEEPEEWSTARGYYLRHSNGEIEIWIANRAYALKVKVGRYGLLRDPGFADRHLLWRRIKRMGFKSPDQIEEDEAMRSFVELQTFGKIARPLPPPSNNR